MNSLTQEENDFISSIFDYDKETKNEEKLLGIISRLDDKIWNLKREIDTLRGMK